MFSFYRSASFFFLLAAFVVFFPISPLFPFSSAPMCVGFTGCIAPQVLMDSPSSKTCAAATCLPNECCVAGTLSFLPFYLASAPPPELFIFLSLCHPFFFYPHGLISQVWDAANRIYSKQSAKSVRQSEWVSRIMPRNSCPGDVDAAGRKSKNHIGVLNSIWKTLKTPTQGMARHKQLTDTFIFFWKVSILTVFQRNKFSVPV